jgi:hypothetical protein
VASTIGIKIANGEFYSIVEENSSVKKRLILTTVHDKQRSVQIDLYKSFTSTMADALYIGSLVVENIKPRPKGEPSIELVISSNKEGEITAGAIDLDSSINGEHHYLNVSLKSLDEDNREYEIPDFELEQHEPPPTGLYEKAKVIHDEETRRPFPWLVVICAALVLVAICIAVWLLLFRGRLPFGGGDRVPEQAASAPASQAQQPPAQAQQPPAQAPAQAQQPPAQAPASRPAAPPPAQAPATQQAPASRPAPASTPVIQAPSQAPAPAPAARRQRPAPPVASYRVPTAIPREGAPYRIRWGDTLWDISEAFYRNPWLYPRIARFNKIRNPDLIISGTTIRIPPRN